MDIGGESAQRFDGQLCREIVAFSKWDYPIQWTDELRQEKERRMGDKSAPLEGSNQALMDEFFKELRRGREKWIVEGETFCKWHTYNSVFLHERVRAFQFLASNDLWHP